ncbi:MAG: hypothetical protein IPP60_10735 [Sphingobacteriales bacterium]|nr:hypothetical protein [Sphingobacteriales bacterium]
MKITENVKAISTDGLSSLILKMDNTVWACGWNNYGQLGNGTTFASKDLIKVTNNVKAICAGRLYIGSKK